MKLEFKLALSTGVLILASLLSAYTAHIRIEEANRLSVTITTQRIPFIMATRDLRHHIQHTTSDLESYMLFGIDPSSSSAFRKSRKQSVADADSAMSRLTRFSTDYNLGTDSASMAAALVNLEAMEDKVEQLNESKTSSGTAQAYDTLQNQILPLERSLVATTSALAESQTNLANDEMDHLRTANRTALYTLWIATLLGAIVGGLISFLLARRITHAIHLVSERANAIASGDLTGQPLDVDSTDQIGSLALAMQQMQTSLAAIIGTLVNTAGTLTGNAASMRTASDQVHRRIDQQSQQTQQAATAMQEMSASIVEVFPGHTTQPPRSTQRRRNRTRRGRHRQTGSR